MNIAICDDNTDFRTFLEDSLRNYFDEKSISLNIFQFKSGEELLANELLFDLIFLDVEMENINGIETGKELKKRNPKFAYCINRNPLLLMLNILPKRLQLFAIRQILKNKEK